MELAKLHSAVTEAGANKSFLVMEAIQRGLLDSDPRDISSRRSCRIDAWVPTEFKEQIKQLAEAHAVTQQSLLRYLIFKHLKALAMEANGTHMGGDSRSNLNMQNTGAGQL
jgi:hypothetical protein